MLSEAPRLPPEVFLENFPGLHEAAMQEDLKSVGSRARVRSFFRDCLREHSNHWYCYRYLSNEFNIERDLRCRLGAWRSENAHDLYRVEVELHDLKLLRRIALQRYAFKLAAEISERLQARGVKRWWLAKDRWLPRMPLALAGGYGVVLGAFKDWLVILGSHLWFTVGLTAFALTFAWLLIYCNVRDRIGDLGSPVTSRTWQVFRISIAWTAALVIAGWLLAMVDEALLRPFNWGVAISFAASALLIAIVVQFFFAKAGSIADPL
jgi:hypothetical protein